jgi:hypothetical protein
MVLLKKFLSVSDLEAALESVDNKTVMISSFDLSEKTSFIFRSISRENLQYCVLQMITFPSPDEECRSLTEQVMRTYEKLKEVKFREYRHYFFLLLQKLNVPWLYRLIGINSPDYIIITGAESRKARKFPVDKGKTRYIWTHTLDYDIYLGIKDQPVSRTEPFAVFLDEDFAGHIEFTIFGNYSSPFAPDEYFSKMRIFFDHVEKHLGIPVIIAAHPRTKNIRDMQEGYQREVIQGDTARLVKESALVITHVSTALNFAILFQKPILFVTTDKLEKRTTGVENEGAYLVAVARSLNQRPVNADHMTALDKKLTLSFDKEAYHRYVEAYIKKEGTPELPFWEIVASGLMK